jgi:hypothetical protein
LLAPLDRRLCLGDADPAVVVLVAFRFADARVQRGDQRLVLGQRYHMEQMLFGEQQSGIFEEPVEEPLVIAELGKERFLERFAGPLGHHPRPLAQIPIHIVVPRHDHHPLPRNRQFGRQFFQKLLSRRIFRRQAPFRHIPGDHHHRRPQIRLGRQVVQILRQFRIQTVKRPLPVRIPMVFPELKIRKMEDGKGVGHFRRVWLELGNDVKPPEK